MTVYIDADACPVYRLAEETAKKYGIPVVLLCDTNHVLSSEYAEVSVIGAGADAVDFALINRCREGDVVLTQDYGVAAMALAKKAYAINQFGMWYTEKNIDGLLADRHMAKSARRASSKNYIKGPSKRKQKDDENFLTGFHNLLTLALEAAAQKPESGR